MQYMQLIYVECNSSTKIVAIILSKGKGQFIAVEATMDHHVVFWYFRIVFIEIIIYICECGRIHFE